MKIALMVIDLQKAYRNETTRDSMKSACEYIDAVVPLFRRHDLPIVWVQNEDEYDGAVPGSPGFDLIDGLEPGDRDIRITKRYGNAFNRTDCHSLLGERGVDTILMTGFSAEHCVLSTYRGASDLDYTPVLLQHGTASADREAIPFVEKLCDVVGYSFLEKLLG